MKIKCLLTLALCAFLLPACQKKTSSPKNLSKDLIYSSGGIVRASTSSKKLSLVFTAHEYVEGHAVLRETLKKHNVKGAFFLTGDCYRNEANRSLILDLKDDGHYMGAHSDKHLLYCAWEDRSKLLVSRKELVTDINNNYNEMAKYGIMKEDAPFYLPPYEWYNDTICKWVNDLGLSLVNFTGGTLSNADYTIPDMGGRYVSSDSIFNRILSYEKTAPNGLNGFLLLTHLGVGPNRTDKLFDRMDALIDSLKQRGYEIVPLRELLEEKKK